MNGSIRSRCGGLSAALLVAAALGLAACGDATQRGGTVVIAAASDLDHANPLVSVDAWTNEVLRYALFTPLVRYGPELEYQPRLAESWELLGDTGVVFHLRDDVRWHDGTPTTAHDVLFTFERSTDPATAFPNADYFARWTGGAVLDSFTVRFSFEPHAEPLAGWPFTPVVPRHLLDSIPPERLRQAAFNRAPVGNGPFRFASQRPGNRWVFEANPDYPEALGGPPLLDRVVWRVIPENSAQLTEIRVGQVDLALQPSPEQVQRLAGRDGLDVVVKPSRSFLFLVWNQRAPPLDDPRVRRGLAMAIDRRQILEGLRRGLGELAIGPVPPFHWAFDHSLEPLPHAPDSARALLADAGVRDRDDDGILEGPDGADFTVQIKVPANNDYYRDVAEAIRDDLAGLGVAATTRLTEVTTLFADVTSPERRFEAALLGWSSDFRLDLRDLFHSDAMDGPYQFASYGNPRVDSLMDTAVTEPDRERAAPLWHQVQGILLEEQPWTLIYYQTDAFLARDRVRGMDMDIRGALVNLPGWWVEEARPELAPAPQSTGG
ncbi:MAG: ABC transporter substrate-binding protein [Gemmatimonadota bacterium]